MKQMMRLFMCIAFTMLCNIMTANAQKAFYVYLDDGSVNVFLFEDVDSITYSYKDKYGYKSYDVECQEFWALDSCYRYSLDEIDSISFVTPETKYRENVINIDDELAKYITSIGDGKLTFSSSTPASLLPKVGEKIVNTSSHATFSYPFAGKVAAITSSANGYDVACDTVALTDIFECYYGVATVEDNSSSSSKAKALANGEKSISLPLHYVMENELLNKWGLDLGYKIDDNLSLSVSKAHLRTTYEPNLKITGYAIVQDKDVSLGIKAFGTHRFATDFAISGQLSCSKEFPLIKKTFYFPEIFCEITPEFGVFAEMSNTINCTSNMEAVYQQKFQWSWSNKPYWSSDDCNEFSCIKNSNEGELSLDGALAIGGYVSATAGFIGLVELDVSNINLKAKGGAKFEGHGVINDAEAKTALTTTDLYEKLSKQGSNRLSLYYGTEISASLFNWSVSYSFPNWLGIPFGKEIEIYKESLVPQFTDTELMRYDDNALWASYTATGNSIPVNIGFCLQDLDNNVISKTCDTEYLGITKYKEQTFEGIDLSQNYVVYPLVRYNNIEMIASPSAKYLSGVEFYSYIDNVGNNFADVYVECTCDASDYKWGLRYSSDHRNWTMMDGSKFASKSDDNSATIRISGLEPNGHYYVEPYCTFNGKTIYGDRMEFDCCSIYTLEASDIDIYRATLNGKLTGSISEYGFELKKIGGDMQTFRVKSKDSDGSLSQKVTKLEEKTEYSYRTYADVGDETIYGNWVNFTTGEIEEVDESDFTAGDMIDLGLSVKWSSKNLGANLMNDEGDRYQWGIAKTDYENKGVNDYYDRSENKFQDIGDDIAGSNKYDAATYRWGNGWRMLSASLADDLCKQCTFRYVHFGEMYGTKVIGPNGNSIFIPHGKEKFSSTCLWTSTIYHWTSSDKFWTGSDMTNYYAYVLTIFFSEGEGISVVSPLERMAGIDVFWASPNADERYRANLIRPVHH